MKIRRRPRGHRHAGARTCKALSDAKLSAVRDYADALERYEIAMAAGRMAYAPRLRAVTRRWPA